MSVLVPNFSQFYYGFQITAEPYNGFIDLDEGAGEISVEVPVGSYTFNEFVVAIQQALATQALLNYTVVGDRVSRLITISADADFDILSNTGSHTGSGIYSLMGFVTTSDYTGADTYTGINPAGKVYRPQFKLQSFIGPDDWQEKAQAKVNISASGTSVEVVNFGLARFMQFEIDYITNKKMDGLVIKNNPQGLTALRDFMSFITAKNYFEIMVDENEVNEFYKVLCESTPEYSDGTGFKLKERYDEGLPGIFKTGVIKLRVL